MRLIVVLTVCLFLLPMAAHAQVSTSGISGMVCVQQQQEIVYASSAPSQGYCPGQGLPGATVQLLARTGVADVPIDETSTDDGGWFRFAEVADGEYILRVTRVGFSDLDAAIKAPAQDEFYLPVQGKDITQVVNVLHPDDSPVVGALVSMCCPGPEYEAVEAKSDANGVANLAMKAGFFSLHAEAQGHYPSQWRYELYDGASTANLTMERTPPPNAFLAGKLTDQNGNPVADARVQVDSWNAPTPTKQPAAEGEAKPGAAGDEARIAPYYGNYQTNFTMTATDGSYRLGTYGGQVNFNAYKDGHVRLYRNIELERGETRTLDLELAKFPDKTAKIVGTVLDASTGKAIPDASVSIETPRFGLYACSNPADAPDQPKPMPAETAPSAEGGASTSIVAPDYYRGCDIQMDGKGGFEGMVTPGYSIVRVHHDYWRACQYNSGETYSCEPKYLQYSKTMDLAADGTTTLEIELRPRTAPDAKLMGYLLDDATLKAIPKGNLNFYHLEGNGWGNAQTDKDGSFKVALRSGPHQLTAYADGHLQWEGIVDIKAGDNRIDIKMRAGESSYGYCCYAYDTPMMRAAGAEGDASGAPAPMGQPSSGVQEAPQAPGTSNQVAQNEGAVQYEDLGGGLGPYDPNSAGTEVPIDDDQGTPMVPVALVMVGLLVLARRRK